MVLFFFFPARDRRLITPSVIQLLKERVFWGFCLPEAGLCDKLMMNGIMSSLLNIIQIVTAILLILFVLLQQRGSGLGGAFGGGGEVYQTKRGVEKGLFVATIVTGVLFVFSGLVRIILP